MTCDGNCNFCSLNTSAKNEKLIDFLKANCPDAESSFTYDSKIHSTPYRVFLGLTARCNLSCPYCFTHQHNEDMTYEIAKKGVEFAIKNHKESLDPEKDNVPSIIFFGGEPMLKFDSIIKPLIEEYGTQINWSMTTNGTLLTEDVVDFLYQHDVNFMLSFDGIKEVQDIQRPGKGFSSYDKVMKNIPYILVRFPDIGMRCTVTKHMIPYIYETYKMCDEIGFYNLICGVNSFEEWTEEDGKKAEKQFKKIAADIYYRLMTPDQYRICKFEPFDRLFKDMRRSISNNNFYDNGVLRCGMGTTTIAICPDGSFVPCQEQVTCPRDVIGNIDTGIDYNLHKKFLLHYFNNIEKVRCENPTCSENCYKICHSVVCPNRLVGDNFKRNNTDCIYLKALYNAFYNLYQLTRGNINPIIRQFTGEEIEYNFVTEENEEKEEKENA